MADYKSSKKYVGVRQVKGSASWSYRFKVVVNGQEITQEKSGFSTAQAASEARAKAIEELKNQGYVTDTGKKIEDVWEEFIKDLNTTRAYETLRKHKSIYENHIYPAFIGRYIASISGQELNTFMNSYKEPKTSARGRQIIYSSEFVNSIYKTLFALWSFASRCGYVKENRVLQVEKIKNRGRQKRDLKRLNDEEIARINKRAENTNIHPAFCIAYFTGIRPAELFALMWSDFDFNENRVHITKQIKYENGVWCIKQPKTPTANRWVYFNQKLSNYLLAVKRKQEMQKEALGAGYRDNERIQVVTQNGEVKYVSGLPFVNRKDNGELLTLNSTKYITRETRLEFGIDWKWYDLRATYASICANDLKMNPSFLKEQMGHQKIETTLTYYTDVDDAVRNTSKELIQTMGIMPTPEEMVYDELSTQGDMVYGVDDEQSGKKVGNGNVLRFENGLLVEQKG